MKVCAVGFGGIPIQRLSAGDAQKLLLNAVDSGINFFDTARGYTDSEEKFGRALSGRRGEIYIATKAMSRDAASMERELEASLRNLRTDMIDLYQLHAVGTAGQLDRVLGPGGAYETLAKARDAGKIRWIGITGHFRPVLLDAVRTGYFDTVQVPFNPIENEWAQDLLPAARSGGVGTIGMKPLAGGAIRNAALSIRFSLIHGIDVSIPGMDAIAQVEENISAARELRDLAEDEIAALEKEKRFWGGIFCRRCGYCLPCPEGLNIPFLLLIEAYYSRYGLREWALERLEGLDKKYASCTGCGECIERCPYSLPIPDLMKKAASSVL